MSSKKTSSSINFSNSNIWTLLESENETNDEMKNSNVTKKKQNLKENANQNENQNDKKKEKKILKGNDPRKVVKPETKEKQKGKKKEFEDNKTQNSKTSNNRTRLLSAIESFKNIVTGLIFACLIGFILNKLLIIHESSSIKPLGEFLLLKDGCKVNYWCEGPKNNKPVTIFIPDFGNSFMQSYRMLKEISESSRFCTFDRPGRGFSDSINQLQAKDVLEELDTFLSKLGENEPYILLGHSYGATISVLHAFENPSKVKGLVLLNPIGASFYSEGGTTIVETVSYHMKIAEVFSIIGFMRLFQMFEFTKGWGYEIYPEISHLLQYNLNQQRVYSVAANELTNLQPKLVELLDSSHSEKLNQSVLIIYSEQYDSKNRVESSINDIWNKITQKDSFKNISSIARLEKIKGGRDFPMIFPKETSTFVNSFIKELKTK